MFFRFDGIFWLAALSRSIDFCSVLDHLCWGHSARVLREFFSHIVFVLKPIILLLLTACAIKNRKFKVFEFLVLEYKLFSKNYVMSTSNLDKLIIWIKIPEKCDFFIYLKLDGRSIRTYYPINVRYYSIVHFKLQIVISFHDENLILIQSLWCHEK